MLSLGKTKLRCNLQRGNVGWYNIFFKVVTSELSRRWGRSSEVIRPGYTTSWFWNLAWTSSTRPHWNQFNNWDATWSHLKPTFQVVSLEPVPYETSFSVDARNLLQRQMKPVSVCSVDGPINCLLLWSMLECHVLESVFLLHLKPKHCNPSWCESS